MKKEEDEIDDIIKEYDDDLDLSGIVPYYELEKIERPAFEMMSKYCEQLGIDHWSKLPQSIIDKCFAFAYDEENK